MGLAPFVRSLALGAGIALAGCSGAGPLGVPPAPAASGQPPRNQCHAAAAQFLLGRPFSADLLEQARAAADADVARLLRVGAIVTQEYRLGRLNVVLDADDRVARIHCG
jgi:hypothetical protein